MPIGQQAGDLSGVVGRGFLGRARRAVIVLPRWSPVADPGATWEVNGFVRVIRQATLSDGQVETVGKKRDSE